MSTTAAAVFSQATQLSESDCEELYMRLGDHLYGPKDHTRQSSELTETLDRRWEEIVSGKVECRDAMTALQELRAKYHV